jgi:hypothetical protein
LHPGVLLFLLYDDDRVPFRPLFFSHSCLYTHRYN